VKLALALGLPTEYKSALTAIGNIRNKFTHNLKTQLTPVMIEELYKVTGPETKTGVQWSFKRIVSHFPEEERPKSLKEMKLRDKLTLLVSHLWAGLRAVNAKNQDATPPTAQPN
jgi:hypothetical protein